MFSVEPQALCFDGSRPIRRLRSGCCATRTLHWCASRDKIHLSCFIEGRSAWMGVEWGFGGEVGEGSCCAVTFLKLLVDWQQKEKQENRRKEDSWDSDVHRNAAMDRKKVTHVGQAPGCCSPPQLVLMEKLLSNQNSLSDFCETLQYAEKRSAQPHRFVLRCTIHSNTIRYNRISSL